MRADDPVAFESLVAYLGGELAPAETARVDAALATSPDGAAELERIRAVIETLRGDDTEMPSPVALRRALGVFENAPATEETAVRANVLDEVVRVVARLVFDSRVQPATAGFRGGADGITLGYDSDLGRVDLRIAEPRDGDGQWRVRGQIRGADECTPGAVALVAPGTTDEAVRQTTDDAGRFRVDAEPGRYDLVVEFDDHRAVIVPELVLE